MRVDQVGVFLKCLEVVVADAVLQLADGVRIQQVVLAIHTEVIATSHRQLSIRIRDGTKRELVLQLRLTC